MLRNVTLLDIFISVLERTGDETSRNIVKKTRILMNAPECSEYLNCLLINALGIPCCIASDVVDKAIDCIIHLHEDDIDNGYNTSHKQKDAEKSAMRSFMEQYRHAVKEFLKKRGLLR